jgi:hypothetical protein
MVGLDTGDFILEFSATLRCTVRAKLQPLRPYDYAIGVLVVTKLTPLPRSEHGHRRIHP